MISSHCTWLVVVGGYDDENYITHPNTTMIVELGKSINYCNYINYIYTVHNDSQWTVGCILDSTKLCTDEYQKKLMNALIHGRQHWSTMKQQLQERDTQLQERDIQLQERDTQLQERDIQLQERDIQLQKKDTQLQEKDTKLQEKDTQLQEKKVQLQDLQVSEHKSVQDTLLGIIHL